MNSLDENAGLLHNGPFSMNRFNGLYQINDKKIKETIDIAGFYK
ncbi:hypothetical protein [Peribacillus simplex]|nr:hypothetical protein [Peribacillus simplex]